jgi:16S rRNA (adenine1518-N6/adenine1519-N6)-dimethyltransferase
VPNVDSVLVRLLRRREAPEPGLRALVQQGFAHRRKALARSVSLAGGSRDDVRAALEAIGKPADARAESLSPEEWRALYERLAAGGRPPDAPPGDGPPAEGRPA